MSSLTCDRHLLKQLVSDEGILHDILYGRWVEWGGKRPPSHVKQNLLQSLPRSVLTNIPSEIFLDVSTLSSRHIGVFAASDIDEKTIIGPLQGKRMQHTNNKEAENSWELLDERNGITSYLQPLDANEGSWMGLIQCARYMEEQNLEMFQEHSNIYYRVIKHIEVGDELLVWYNVHIPQCLGIPELQTEKCKNSSLNSERENQENCTLLNSDDERKKVTCVLCYKGFNSKSNLRSHMRTHTNRKPFKCNTCNRQFSQSSTLRNHIRLHTGEKPYKCITCHSAYSQLAGLRAHQKSSQHQRPK